MTTHSTRSRHPDLMPINASSHAPLAAQIAAQGWVGGMFRTPWKTEHNVVYFNPAIRLGTTPHLFARECRWNGHWSQCSNQIVRLDIEDDRIVNPKVVSFDKLHPTESWEDPRIYVGSDGITRLGVAAWYLYQPIKVSQVLVDLDGKDDARKTRISPIYGHNARDIFWNTGNEKNWMWFEDPVTGGLKWVYSVSPHVVCEYQNGDIVAHTTKPAMHCPTGELRGGTNPIRIGDEYLAFIHWSVPWKTIPKYGLRRRYFTTAYMFHAEPPYAPTRWIPEHLLAGSEHDAVIPGSPAVVFPCGLADEGDTLFMTFGSNDCECGWARIPKEDLLSRMVPC